MPPHAISSPAPVALFVLGVGGSGKSTLCEAFAREEISRSIPWCLIDKDVVGSAFVPRYLASQGLDPQDRDSDGYMTLCRDMEYATCLIIAAQQLELGGNVVLPGPWTRELSSGNLFSATALGLPPCQLRHVFLKACPRTLRQRVEQRNSPRDAWKLANWELYQRRVEKMNALALDSHLPEISARLPLCEQIEHLRNLVSR
jgi:GTPase SAR1 family protein